MRGNTPAPLGAAIKEVIRNAAIAEVLRTRKTFARGVEDSLELLRNAEHDKEDLNPGSTYSQAADLRDRLSTLCQQAQTTIKDLETLTFSPASGRVRIGDIVQVLRGWEVERFCILPGVKSSRFLLGEIDYQIISPECPVGKGLLGKEAGETVIIGTPDGKEELKIIKIS